MHPSNMGNRIELSVPDDWYYAQVFLLQDIYIGLGLA